MSTNTKDEGIGERIFYLMRDRGVTDKELEEHLGIGKGMVSLCKYGGRNTYLHYIKAIYDFLGTNPNYLFRGVTEGSNGLKPIEEDVLRMLRMLDAPPDRNTFVKNYDFLRKNDYESTLSKRRDLVKRCISIIHEELVSLSSKKYNSIKE